MEWISNAKFNQDLKEGTIFTLKGAKVSICIHKIYGLGDRFYLTCRNLNIEQMELNTADFDLAVENATVIIREKLKMLNEYFSEFLTDESENIFVRY